MVRLFFWSVVQEDLEGEGRAVSLLSISLIKSLISAEKLSECVWFLPLFFFLGGGWLDDSNNSNKNDVS